MYCFELCCFMYCFCRLCCSVYCLFVNVYSTITTGCLYNQLNIPYHIVSYHIISYHIISYHIISYHIISYHIISYRLNGSGTRLSRSSSVCHRRSYSASAPYKFIHLTSRLLTRKLDNLEHQQITHCKRRTADSSGRAF